MNPVLFWLILFLLFVAPVIHVALAQDGGPWLPPRGTRLGWLVAVLLLGPIGWFLYMGRRHRS